MPIITECTEPGCDVKTMGPWCIEHERETRHSPMLRDIRFPEAVRVAREATEEEPAFSVLGGATRQES